MQKCVCPDSKDFTLACAWENCHRLMHMFVGEVPYCYDHYRAVQQGKEPGFRKDPGIRVLTTWAENGQRKEVGLSREKLEKWQPQAAPQSDSVESQGETEIMAKDEGKKTIRDFVVKTLSKQKLTKAQLAEKIHKEFGEERDQKTTLRYINMLFNKLRKSGHKLEKVEDRGAVGVYKITC